MSEINLDIEKFASNGLTYLKRFCNNQSCYLEFSRENVEAVQEERRICKMAMLTD